MAVPTNWCALMVILPLIQVCWELCAQCGAHVLLVSLRPLQGTHLVAQFYRRTRPNGQREAGPDLNPGLLGPRAHVPCTKLYDLLLGSIYHEVSPAVILIIECSSTSSNPHSLQSYASIDQLVFTIGQS